MRLNEPWVGPGMIFFFPVFAVLDKKNNSIHPEILFFQKNTWSLNSSEDILKENFAYKNYIAYITYYHL